MNESCENCRFFKAIGEHEGGGCRRNPPPFVATEAGWWCGEYVQLREKAKPFPEAFQESLPEVLH